MKNVKAVIGANYGDEGKGRIVDYLVSKVDPKDIKNTLVVRFNGGAQAGHTVQTDKIRHVFSHFCAGTICGAPTYLSKFFILNSMSFTEEYLELAGKNIYPITYVDEEAEITTPLDVLVNRSYELAKSAHIKGSVGLAIWETTERAKHISIRAKDLRTPSVLKHKCWQILNDWFMERSKEYQMLPVVQEDIRRQSYALEKAFLYYCDFMRQRIVLVDSSIMNKFDNVIFEGAQGLLLDITLDYTYGTASHTGLENVEKLIGASILDSFTVIYATRPYVTRHGGGFLPYEQDIGQKGFMPYDETNQFHVWQREFRKGLLDIDTLRRNIKRDLFFGKFLLAKKWEIELFASCADQIDDMRYYHYYKDGILLTEDFLVVMRQLAQSLMADKLYFSYGPQRDAVTEIQMC